MNNAAVKQVIDSIESLELTNGFAHAVPDVEATHPLHPARQAQSFLHEALRAFRANVTRIQNDNHLTEAGKTAHLQDACRAALGKIQESGVRDRVLRPLEGKIATAEAALRTPKAKTPEETLVNFLRESEVRGHLRTMSDMERVIIFNNAVQNGDSITVDAVLNAPALFGLVDDDTMAKGRAAWESRQNPEAAQNLDQLRDGLKATESALESTVSMLREAGQIDSEQDIIERIESTNS